MAERTFLITGATGFLGGAATVAALRAGYGPQLRLAVRGSADGTPAMRLFNNLRRLGATEQEFGSLGQDFMLEADLAQNGAFAGHPLLKPVERVIHAAALPTFSNNSLIRSINIDGTLALRSKYRIGAQAWLWHLRGAAAASPLAVQHVQTTVVGWIAYRFN